MNGFARYLNIFSVLKQLFIESGKSKINNFKIQSKNSIKRKEIKDKIEKQRAITMERKSNVMPIYS